MPDERSAHEPDSSVPGGENTPDLSKVPLPGPSPLSPETYAEAHSLEDFLLALGRSQLAAGYAVDDVTTTLNAVARAYGRPDLNIAVLPGIVLVDDPLIGRARVVSEGVGNTLRLDQAAAVHEVAAEARRGDVNPREGTRILDELPARPPRFPLWASVLGYALASAGFALIFRVSLWGVAMAAILGLFVGWLLALTRHRPNLLPLVPLFAAIVSAFSVFGFASLIDAEVQPLRVVVAPLIALIPGAALTRATQELASGHLISGSSRLVAAIVQILVLTFGILIGTLMARVSPYDISDVTVEQLPLWVAWIGACVYAAGQALAFNVPHGAIRYVVLLLLIAFSVQQFVAWRLDAVLAAGVAAAIALFLALLIQDRVRNGPPAFVLFTPVFWLLVPGSLGLVGLTEVITGAEASTATPVADQAQQSGLTSIADIAGSGYNGVLLTAGASIIAITIGMQIASIAGRVIRRLPDLPEVKLPGRLN